MLSSIKQCPNIAIACCHQEYVVNSLSIQGRFNQPRLMQTKTRSFTVHELWDLLLQFLPLFMVEPFAFADLVKQLLQTVKHLWSGYHASVALLSRSVASEAAFVAFPSVVSMMLRYLSIATCRGAFPWMLS